MPRVQHALLDVARHLLRADQDALDLGIVDRPDSRSAPGTRSLIAGLREELARSSPGGCPSAGRGAARGRCRAIIARRPPSDRRPARRRPPSRRRPRRLRKKQLSLAGVARGAVRAARHASSTTSPSQSMSDALHASACSRSARPCARGRAGGSSTRPRRDLERRAHRLLVHRAPPSGSRRSSSILAIAVTRPPPLVKSSAARGSIGRRESASPPGRVRLASTVAQSRGPQRRRRRDRARRRLARASRGRSLGEDAAPRQQIEGVLRRSTGFDASAALDLAEQLGALRTARAPRRASCFGAERSLSREHRRERRAVRLDQTARLLGQEAQIRGALLGRAPASPSRRSSDPRRSK